MSADFTEHLNKIRTARGLPIQTEPTTLDLQQHARREIEQTIGQSTTPARFRLLPGPEAVEGDAHVVEVRMPLPLQEIAFAGVSENGTTPLRANIRRQLAQSITTQLMASEWVKVEVDGNDVIASLTVQKGA